MISPTKIKTAVMATILHPRLPIKLAPKNSKPPYFHVGRAAQYRRSNLEKFILHDAVN
jgi:hypothetical protein